MQVTILAFITKKQIQKHNSLSKCPHQSTDFLLIWFFCLFQGIYIFDTFSLNTFDSFHLHEKLAFFPDLVIALHKDFKP